MARSRSRNSTAKSDRRESNGDDSNRPKESQSESDSPLSFEYETEDGLKVSVEPGEVELSREYELSETDLIEFSAGIDFSAADVEVKKKGLNVEASGEVSLPGNLLGVSGGIVIDLKTGEISGGELGVELGGFGIEVSAQGEDGCRKAIKLSIGPVSIAYVRDDCNDEDEEEDDKEEIKDPQPEPSSGNQESQSSTRKFTEPGVYIYLCRYKFSAYLEDSLVEEKWIPSPPLTWQDLNRLWGINKTDGEWLAENYPGWQPNGGIFVISSNNIESFEIVETWTRGFVRGAAYSYTMTEGRWREGMLVPIGYRVYTIGITFYDDYCSADGVSFRAYRPGILFGEIAGATKYINIRFNDPREKYVDFCSDFEIKLVQIDLSIQKKKLPSGPPPVRNNPKCCQETAEMLADIYEVLAVDELLDKKLKVPNRLVATNAKGSQLLGNYLEILAFMIRETDHLGIHPFTAILQDSNEAQEGDQTIEETYVNATAAINKIIELLLENKGDSSNRLNLLVRIAWINVQILNTATVIVRGVQGLISFLGMPVREIIDKVTMPFDVTLGRREKAAKGFGVNIKGKKPSREEILKTLDLNEEDDLEAILPEFLETTDQPVKSETFNDDNGMGLIDMLRIVLRR